MEMSMVLVVIGLILTLVYPALVSLRQTTQHNLTASNLTALMRATAAYAQANGCVPCPSRASAPQEGFGRVRGDAVALACGGVCYPEGIPPYISLGLPAAMAKDGWGHWITMRVDPALAANFAEKHNATAGLCDATLSTTTSHPTVETQGVTGQQKAAVLFVSHGANGWGAYRPDPAELGTLDTHPVSAEGSAYEQLNIDDNTAFYQGVPSPDPLIAFDDQLLYMGRDALLTMLGTAGCNTSWGTVSP